VALLAKTKIAITTALEIKVKSHVTFVPIENAAPGFRRNENCKNSPITWMSLPFSKYVTAQIFVA
jgi:hypothetical protein